MANVQNETPGGGRPYSLKTFQNKLDQFEQFMADITMQDSDASPEEKRQAIIGKLQ